MLITFGWLGWLGFLADVGLEESQMGSLFSLWVGWKFVVMVVGCFKVYYI